jgi:ribosomal protein L37AE/L43A
MLSNMHATDAISMLVHGSAFGRACAGPDRREVTHGMWRCDKCGFKMMLVCLGKS